MLLTNKLIEKGIITKDQADSLIREIKTSEEKEERILLSKKILTEEELFKLKSEVLGVPFKDILPIDVSLDILKLIPQRTAENYNMIPLVKNEGFIEVGMIYPEDLSAQEALKFLSRRWELKPKVVLIKPSVFGEILKRYGSLKEEVTEILGDEGKDIPKEEVKKGAKATMEEMKKMVEEAPVSKAVASILQYAVEEGASDVHVEPGRKELRIRFRMLGSLYSSIKLPLRFHKLIVSRIKILSLLKLDEQRIPQDGRFSTTVDDRPIDFRVSTFPTTLGEKVVIRILDSAAGFKTFKELGLSGRNMETVERAIAKPYGLILVTGPTGCGKTTTLYSALRVLNKEDVNVITLEDPVEYFIKGVNQSQVRPEIDYTFARGLRHIVRQDPDIIMVGEVRDTETASLAIHAALTGHIVLSTLHTNDALGAVPRLVDLGIHPFLIPATLSLVIAQRLVRTLCPHCMQKVKPNAQQKTIITSTINSLPKNVKKDVDISKTLYIWEAKGCRHCSDRGYIGRIGLFEIFEVTDRLSSSTLKGLSESVLKKEAEKQSMITMRQDGILKVLKGITTISEVITSTQAKTN